MNLLCPLTLILLISLVKSSVDFEVITPTFAVHNVNNVSDQWIEVPNKFRLKSSLKLRLLGGTIKTVEERSPTWWNVVLTDQSSVQFTSVKHHDLNVTEYRVLWPGSSADREVCFDYGFNQANWYYTYQSFSQEWPMNLEKSVIRQAFNFPLFYFAREAYNIVEHLFLTSDGFALMLDQHQPLFIRRTRVNGESIVCFSCNNSSPYMASNTNSSYKDIKFSLFASDNIKSVYEKCAIELGNIDSPVAIPDESLFTHPIWSNELLHEVNQSSVMKFAYEIKEQNFSSSFIDVAFPWQKHFGDLTFDIEIFPDAKQMASNLHKLGQKFMLDVNSHFEVGYNVSEESQKNLFKASNGAMYVDFSNIEASDWFSERMNHFRHEYYIDAFRAFHYSFDGPIATSDAHYRAYPGLYARKYAESMANLGSAAVNYFAYKTQHLPNFVQILSRNANWTSPTGLQSLIPTVLSLSIGGYSFIVPDIVRGHTYELYIRWLQAITFMPAMQFSVPPWYANTYTETIAKKCVDLHAQYAPTIIELAKKRVHEGTPIIRPMWYAAPDDSQSFTINNQFMLGNDLLVAPVLVEGERERMVYLPSGKWIDQHGKDYSGPGNFKVEAPLDELPYFKRQI